MIAPASNGSRGATILGISSYYHDSAAALVRSGDIVAAAQEERFTRTKGDPRFPEKAVAYCLAEADLALRDLDYLVFYENHLDKFDRILETSLDSAPRGARAFREAMPIWAAERLELHEEIPDRLDGFRGEFLVTDHHRAHAASAFFPSPFRTAGILTLDAVGEWATSTLGLGLDSRLDLTHEQRFPHSLGMLYSAFTYYAGFKVNSGEYKLMGLAPYGSPRYVDVIRDHVADVREDGTVVLDMGLFDFDRGGRITSEAFHDLFGGPPRRPDSFITHKEMDLAASIQKVCEEVVLKAAAEVHRRHATRHLVMAGGVALNCVANGRLLREGPYEGVWIQPAAGDAGGALGAALSVWYETLDNPRRPAASDSQQGSFLGPGFGDEESAMVLDFLGAAYTSLEEEDLLEAVAEALASEKVVGWFQGRMEYGPRALGHRSILGDPRSARMQQTMNLKIKYRESFRPFAPCVLREHASEVFEVEPDVDSPYMLFVAPVRRELRTELDSDAREKLEDPDLRVRVSVPRSRIPAVTHVDYSARIQTVDEARHGLLYRLMKRFHGATGCPVLVNTSFNVRGEPIVCTPEDAFHCFMGTEMDALVIGGHLLYKDEQASDLLGDSELHRSDFDPD